MRILIVGDETIGWEIRAWKKALPKFRLLQVEMPQGFPSFEKAIAWNRTLWTNVKRLLKKRGHTIVVIPAKMATKWGSMWPPREVRFDMAISIGSGFGIAAGHADIVKTIEAKSVIEATRLLLALLKEVL